MQNNSTDAVGQMSTIGLVWAAIGLFVAISDFLTIAKFGVITYSATLCAQAGDINCVTNGISTLILFLVDVAIGPFLLAVNFIENPFLGLFGTIIGLTIIYFSYRR